MNDSYQRFLAIFILLLKFNKDERGKYLMVLVRNSRRTIRVKEQKLSHDIFMYKQLSYHKKFKNILSQPTACF